MIKHSLVLGPLFVAASCASVPTDPYLRGRYALEEGELLGAIAAFDNIPPTHDRYGEARIFVQAVERRIRRAQELLDLGLELRAQWRDEEAIAQFERARAVWPELQGVDSWITSTRSRMEAMAARDNVPVHNESTLDDSTGPKDPPAAPGPETVVAEELPPEVLESQRRLSDGDLDAAIAGFDDLLNSGLSIPEVTAGLADGLEQRAMQRYGQGYLEEALADWARLLEHAPDRRSAKAFAQAAQIELEQRQPWQ